VIDGSDKLETVIVCTDGSDLARRAATAGVALLKPVDRVVVVTVVQAPDEMELTGTGTAGGVMTPEEFADLDGARQRQGQTVAEQTAALLAPLEAEIQVLQGDPGMTLCAYARESSAAAIVMGRRGQGRIKRALMGSVSDHVMRNAHCPVVVSGPPEGDG
jgi:nucleotide-binding universal stress UspA family protein